MYNEYVIDEIDSNINSFSIYVLEKKVWKVIKKDILILNVIIERSVNIGILTNIINTNINQKNKTILRKYNVQSKIKLNIDEIKLLKKYIIEN